MPSNILYRFLFKASKHKKKDYKAIFTLENAQ